MNDRYYSMLGLAGMKEVRSYIVPGPNPAVNVMVLTAAQKVIDEVKSFLG
jgi:hypothetical protein